MDRQDRGYRADAYLYTATIDGVKLSGCITADEEEGLAVCYVHDADTGRLRMDPDRPGERLRDTVHGKIVIIRPAGATK